MVMQLYGLPARVAAEKLNIEFRLSVTNLNKVNLVNIVIILLNSFGVISLK